MRTLLGNSLSTILLKLKKPYLLLLVFEFRNWLELNVRINFIVESDFQLSIQFAFYFAKIIPNQQHTHCACIVRKSSDIIYCIEYKFVTTLCVNRRQWKCLNPLALNFFIFYWKSKWVKWKTEETGNNSLRSKRSQSGWQVHRIGVSIWRPSTIMLNLSTILNSLVFFFLSLLFSTSPFTHLVLPFNDGSREFSVSQYNYYSIDGCCCCCFFYACHRSQKHFNRKLYAVAVMHVCTPTFETPTAFWQCWFTAAIVKPYFLKHYMHT